MSNAKGSGARAASAGIGTHYRRYATGNLMVILAGLVSFPVLTRLLDNEQYGMFGYYGTFVVIAVAIGKLGAQHAILRFFPHGGDAAQLQRFSTNFFFLPLMFSLALWALVALAMVLLLWAAGIGSSPMFWLVLFAIPLTVFESLVDSVQKVTERSQVVMYSRVAARWTELLLMLGAVVLVQASAVAAYSGKLAAAVAMVVVYGLWMRRHLKFSRTAIDPMAAREGLVYGLPMVFNEIVGATLMSLDRWMIKAIVGDFSAVGIYTIGSSLAMQVSLFMNASVFEAFLPAANRLYMTEGPAAVRALKARVLMPMTYACVGVAALLWCFGADLIIAASGAAKAASGPVFAMLGVVCALQPVLLLAGYGLLLEKRSTKVVALVCAALVLNGALNLWLIPGHGVMGAVYATVASSLALGIAHCAWVPRALLQLPDRRTVVVATGVALVGVAAVTVSGMAGLGAGWPRLMVGGTLLGSFYGLAVLALDARVRGLLRQWRYRASAQAPSAG